MTASGFFAPVTSPRQLNSFTQYRSVRPPPPTRPTIQVEASRQAGSVPVVCARPVSVPTLTVTNATPSPTPPTSSPPPPDYPNSSPPKYAPIPLSSERALLLAPPPSFYETGYCPHCLEQSTPCHCRRRHDRADWVVRLLVILNVIVWAAVIWGYVHEWNDPDLGYPGCIGIGIGYGYPGCPGNPNADPSLTCIGEARHGRG